MYVEFLGIPRERAGISELEIEADTLGQLLEALAARCPALRRAHHRGRPAPVDRGQPERRRVRQRSAATTAAAREDDPSADPSPTPAGSSDGCTCPSATTAAICASTSRRGRAERVPLSEAVLRQYIGGSGLGARLLLDEGGRDRRSALARSAARLRLQPAGRQSAHHLRQVRRRQPEPADRALQRLAGQQRLCARRQALRLRRHRHRRAGAGAVGARHRRRRGPARAGRRRARRRVPASTEETLRARLGADYRIASIGPAGERGVRYATISHDGRHAGRGGSGAVLGSKNIKAIAVRGTQRCEWAHPRELTALSRDLSKRSFGPATAKYRELGTATNLLTFNRFGTLPTRNFQSGTFEEAREPVARAAERRACAHASELCRVHDRLRAHLLAGQRAACGSSTRACSRSGRCAASATATPCCARRSAATSSASTPSAPAAPSPSRWSASSAACSTSRG